MIFTRVARGLQPRNDEPRNVNMFGRRTVRKDMMTRTVPNIPRQAEHHLIYSSLYKASWSRGASIFRWSCELADAVLLGIVRISMVSSTGWVRQGGSWLTRTGNHSVASQFGRGLLHVKPGIYCERCLDLGDIRANSGHRGSPSCICEHQGCDVDHFHKKWSWIQIR